MASKFWEISRDGKTLTVRFGPIGAIGQTKIKQFESSDASHMAEEKAISEKLKKGYVEVSGVSDATSEHVDPVENQNILEDNRFFKALACCQATSSEDIIEIIISGRKISRQLFDETSKWWFAGNNPLFLAITSYLENWSAQRENSSLARGSIVKLMMIPENRDNFASCLLSRYQSHCGEGAREFEGQFDPDNWRGSRKRDVEGLANLFQSFFETEAPDLICSSFLNSEDGRIVLAKFGLGHANREASMEMAPSGAVIRGRKEGTVPSSYVPSGATLLGVYQDWLNHFVFERYVGSGYESKLAGVSSEFIWTEIHNGLNGDFVINAYLPPDDRLVPQGYYVMKMSWSQHEERSLTLSTSYYEDCTLCDGDDSSCKECSGEGEIFLDLFELADLQED